MASRDSMPAATTAEDSRHTVTTTQDGATTSPPPEDTGSARTTPTRYEPDRVVVVAKRRNPYNKKKMPDEHSFYQACLDEGSCKMSRIREIAESEGYEFDDDQDFVATVIAPFREASLFLFAEDLDQKATAKLDAKTKQLLSTT
jgi:hypothetical protein